MQPRRWWEPRLLHQRRSGQPVEPGAALAAAQALLADLGGPRVALAEAPPQPSRPQHLTGTWDKVRRLTA